MKQEGEVGMTKPIDEGFRKVSLRAGTKRTAKSTVMKLNHSCSYSEFGHMGEDDCAACQAKKQAKISYKAGYEAGSKQRRLEENPLVQQGMRKVVEWIEKNKGYYAGDDTFTMLEFEWQQFLKDSNLEAHKGME